MKQKISRLVFSALMLALANVLSILKIDMPMGGGLTIASMLPIVLVALKYGLGWSLGVSFLHGGIQLLLGLDNLSYATNGFVAVMIVLFDYIVAYGVLGFSGVFKKRMPIVKAALLGETVTFSLRFLCHFVTGWFVWDALWPNEYGMISPIYSLCYNGIYMLPELIITMIITVAILKIEPAKKTLLDE